MKLDPRPFEQRQKSRLRARADDGEEVALILPRGRVLRGGDRVHGDRRARGRDRRRAGEAAAHRVGASSRASPTTSATATCRCRSAQASCASPRTTCWRRWRASLARASRTSRRRSSPRPAPTAHQHDEMGHGGQHPRSLIGTTTMRSMRLPRCCSSPARRCRRRLQLFAGPRSRDRGGRRQGRGDGAGVDRRCARALGRRAWRRRCCARRSPRRRQELERLLRRQPRDRRAARRDAADGRSRWPSCLPTWASRSAIEEPAYPDRLRAGGAPLGDRAARGGGRLPLVLAGEPGDGGGEGGAARADRGAEDPARAGRPARATGAIAELADDAAGATSRRGWRILSARHETQYSRLFRS